MTTTGSDRDALLGALATCTLPAAVRLRERLRAPWGLRLAVLGRRGAGKSSLLDALARAPVAPTGDVADTTRAVDTYPFEPVEGTAITWIDTPGLRAGGQRDRDADVVASVAALAPDLVLFAVPATEVDAAIDDDVRGLTELLAVLDHLPRVPPVPVLAVVSRVDELDPPDDLAAPFTEEKRTRIAHARDVLASHLGRARIAPRDVVAVASYVRFDEHGRCTEALVDGLDVLRDRIVGLLAGGHLRQRACRAETLRAELLAVVAARPAPDTALLDALIAAFVEPRVHPARGAGWLERVKSPARRAREAIARADVPTLMSLLPVENQ